MCEICRQYDLDPASKAGKKMLVGLLREAYKEHKWHYTVATMSDAEAVFYDLDSPLRRRNGEE